MTRLKNVESMAFKLRPLVKQQLFEIFDYTADTFGEAQAEKYLKELSGVFEMISSNPHIGHAYHATTRQFIHGRHIIVYEVVNSDVIITRLFHAAQRR